jgi:hypothetical protein
VVLNDPGYTPQGPEFIVKAMGAGALAQKGHELFGLFLSEARLATRMPFGVEASLGVLIKRGAPATDGTGGCLYMACHLSDPPASLQQGYGNATSDFELELGAFGSHTTLIGEGALFL